VNFEGILAAADQLINQAAPPEARQMWPKIRDGLGLPGLKRIVYTGGFDGKDWLDAVFVAAPPPRVGLLKLGEATPLPPDALKVAPKSSTYVAAARADLAGLVGAIREGIRQFDANAGQQVDAIFGQLAQVLGMDVQKDLLGALGDQWVVYTDPNTGGYGFVGTVIVNKLADAARAEQSFSRLEQFLNQVIAQNLRDEKITISFQTRQAGNLTLHYLAVPLVTPTWAIRDGNLYFALYPQPVTVAADFVSKKGPSILENESYQAMRKRLGVENADGVQFYDLPRMAPMTYGEWVAISRLVGFGDLFGVKSPLLLLPPMDKLLAELTPAGAVSWQDPAGFHLRSVSPFPGSTILATDPLSAYMSSAGPALSLSILLPSLSRARETANRVKSGSNLRQIGMGVMLYANENNGACPPDLGTILKTQDLNAGAFVAPQSGKPVPPGTPDQLAGWVNQNADYVYLGKGKKMSDLRPDQPLAYEKFELGRGQGVNVLFGDGHVEWMSMPEATRVLGNPGGPAAPR
jgi:prepilin-type processing-associated H-X9-DG protein